MRTSTSLQYSQDPRELAARAVALERGRARHRLGGRGLHLRRPEPHGVPGRLDADAPDRGPASCRSTPGPRPLTAMTAAGVDALSGGRCILGLGASGPQVIEGLARRPYDKPLGRTREIVEICRKVWAREAPLTHDGPSYRVPLPAGQGTGLGQGAQDHQPARPAPDPDLARRPRRAERDAHRRDRRRVAPAVLRPERTQAAFGPALAAGPGQARSRPRLAGDRRRRDAGHHRRRRRGGPAARPGPPPGRPLRGRHGGQGAPTSTTPSSAATAGRPRRRRSRTSTWPARRPKPRRPSRPSCWRRPRWWARKASSRTASPPTAMPASPSFKHRAPRPRSRPARGAPHVVALTAVPIQAGARVPRPSHSSSASRSAAGWGRAK